MILHFIEKLEANVPHTKALSLKHKNAKNIPKLQIANTKVTSRYHQKHSEKRALDCTKVKARKAMTNSPYYIGYQVLI